MESDLSRLERAFDSHAAYFDAKYASSWVMPILRRRFRALCAEHFPEGGRLLDIGCGTGEDALYFTSKGYRLTAVDPSGEMLRTLARKSAAQSLKIEAFQLATRNIAALSATHCGEFDGAFAFLGPINYDKDLRPFAREMALLLRPGAPCVFSSVNRICLWEIASGLLTRRGREALRRLSPDGVDVEVGEDTLRAFPHSWKDLAEQFSDGFVPVQTVALSTFLPPPYLEHLMREEPWGKALEALEDTFSGLWPLSRFGDHQVMVFKRK